MKKILALVLVLAMALSCAACASTENSKENVAEEYADTKLVDQLGQIYMGTDAEVDVQQADVHMDAVEVSANGNFEALYVPIEIEGRANDYLDFDLTPTAEELEAMKNEPIYGQPILYLVYEGCSSATSVADINGYYKDAGLVVEGLRGATYVEALGTDQAQVAISHIATSLVPITNGVDITFVGGAHLACKSLFVLADSPYMTTEDLKGTKISVPNGIGKSDYNITSLMLDDDGINPQKDVELIQVSADACVAAMENGEISAALLSDIYAFPMMKEGKLRVISSMLDSDYSEVSICCAISMSGKFVKENPVHAKKLTQAIQKAGSWLRENPDEAVDLMLAEGLASGDREMNKLINGSYQFGLSNEFAYANFQEIVSRYIKLGLITSMDDVQEVVDLAWTNLVD